MIIDSLKKATRIFVFKAGPQDMPKSNYLFFTSLIILYLCKVFTELPILSRLNYNHGAFGQLILSALGLILYYLVLFLGLLIRKQQTRFLQTAIAAVTTNIFLYLLVALNALLLVVWSNVITWATGHWVLNFSFNYFEVWVNSSANVLEPLYLFIILPHIYKTSFNVSYKRAILVSVIIALVTIAFESNLVRLLLT